MFVGAPFEASEEPVSQEKRASNIVSDIAARKAIRITTYLKSGNTRVRVFLHKLMHELRGVSGAQDINMLRARLRELTGRESLDRAFAHRLGRPAKDAVLAEIATSLAESAVHSLTARRMVKRQQMRWSKRDAHLMLEVREAVINGNLREQPSYEPPILIARGLVVQADTAAPQSNGARQLV